MVNNNTAASLSWRSVTDSDCLDRTKKDYSTAIMDRKKAPHKLSVEDSKQDDNSIVEMTQAKMDELKIFRGDAVVLKGKKTISKLFFQ